MGFLFQVIFAWVCLKIGHPQKSMLYHGHFPDLKWPFWVLYRPTVYSYSTSFSDMLRCLCQQQNQSHQASLHLALAMVTALNRRAAEPLEAGHVGHVGHVRFGATWDNLRLLNHVTWGVFCQDRGGDGTSQGSIGLLFSFSQLTCSISSTPNHWIGNSML